MRLAPGDRLILCSDGLSDLVEPAEIEAILQKRRLDEGVGHLLNLALERGGHDNITVLGLEMPTRRAMAALLAPPANIRRRVAAAGCLVVSRRKNSTDLSSCTSILN
ncbi:MAG: hypothetical protein HGA82_02715 [Anaerolineales bacterium]|nr:hypothetical protein [Anaerolineales bacterium]